MKNTSLYLLFLALPLMFCCNQSEQKTAELKDTATHKECFTAIDEKDTANLILNNFESGKITGHLLINYLDKGKNDGEISGTFKGDTLFVDYTFKIGTENQTMYKNPLAFLKKDGKLILGVGQIETSMGKSYFVKDKPINFEKGRFTFDPIDCKE